MKKTIGAALAAAILTSSVPAFAQDYDRGYDAHGYDRNHHYYREHDRYYRHRCGGGNGAVGTVAGGVGGAVIGSAVGGGALGTVAGGVGGALLGRHLDKVHTRHRNGC